MGLYTYHSESILKTERISRLVENLFAKMPEIESARAVLLTESYRATENEPMIIRRAKAFEHILKNIPIVIRDEELIVGSTTLAPRGCQTYPEFSFEWLEDEFDTVARRQSRISGKYTSTGKGRRQVNWQLPIWRPRRFVQSITIFSHQEIIFTMV